LIGRRFEDATVQADMKHWPFEVISDGGKPKIRISYKGENKVFSPEEVINFLFLVIPLEPLPIIYCTTYIIF